MFESLKRFFGIKTEEKETKTKEDFSRSGWHMYPCGMPVKKYKELFPTKREDYLNPNDMYPCLKKTCDDCIHYSHPKGTFFTPGDILICNIDQEGIPFPFHMNALACSNFKEI